jgi:hypothetical protein
MAFAFKVLIKLGTRWITSTPHYSSKYPLMWVQNTTVVSTNTHLENARIQRVMLCCFHTLARNKRKGDNM